MKKILPQSSDLLASVLSKFLSDKQMEMKGQNVKVTKKTI